jgi:hypothetical protein
MVAMIEAHCLRKDSRSTRCGACTSAFGPDSFRFTRVERGLQDRDAQGALYAPARRRERPSLEVPLLGRPRAAALLAGGALGADLRSVAGLLQPARVPVLRRARRRSG